MPFKFNKELWTIGQKIEDEALPKLNKYFTGLGFGDTQLQRDENNIWDILDFKDVNNKVIVEVKGRLIPSTKFEDTIITASKVMAGHQAIDDGYKVYFLFVFTDKSMIIELTEEQSFKVRFTGTNCIKHYCIPITELKDFDPDEQGSSVQGSSVQGSSVQD
tara:strand:+ start:219 stop:701 length:483 start_codon:yes stop_codon:yes gene_type:complete